MADAQYTIDIAAQMSGGVKTATELDKITNNLMGAGKGADHFQRAIAQTSTALEQAKARADSANAALKEGATTYAQLEAAAHKAGLAAEKASATSTKVADPAALDALAKKARQASAAITAQQATIEALRAQGAPTDAIAGQVTRLRELQGAYRKVQSAQEKAAAAPAIAADAQARAAEATAALTAYGAKLKGLEATAAAAGAKHEKLTHTLTNLKTLSGHVDKRYAQQAESLEKLGGALGAVGGPLGALGQKTVMPAAGFAKLSSSIGGSRAAALLGTVALVALAAAVVALGAAALAAGVRFARFVLETSSAKAAADAAAEGLGRLDPALAGVASRFDELSHATGVSEDAISGLAESLSAAKVTAAQMPAALRAVTIAELALGKGGGAKFIAAMKASGIAVKDFAAEAEARLGDLARKRFYSLEVQGNRLKKALTGLFAKVDTSGFGKAIARIVDLFKEGAEASESVRVILNGLFDPLGAGATDAADALEAFVLGGLIGLTKLYIKVKPLYDEFLKFLGLDGGPAESTLASLAGKGEGLVGILETIGKVALFGIAAVGAIALSIMGFVEGFSDAMSAAGDIMGNVFDALGFGAGKFDALAIAGKVLKGIFYVLGAALGIVVGAVGLAISGVAALTAGVVWAGEKLLWLGATVLKGLGVALLAIPAAMLEALAGLVSFAGSAVTKLLEVFGLDAWANMGRNIVDGMIKGITGAAGKLWSAAADLAAGTLKSAKKVLGIASPSKAFEKDVGDNSVDGVKKPWTERRAEVHQEISKTVAPQLEDMPEIRTRSQMLAANDGGNGGALDGGSGTYSGGGSGSAPAIHLTIEAGAIVIPTTAGAEETKEVLEEAIVKLLESAATRVGAAGPNAEEAA